MQPLVERRSWPPSPTEMARRLILSGIRTSAPQPRGHATIETVRHGLIKINVLNAAPWLAWCQLAGQVRLVARSRIQRFAACRPHRGTGAMRRPVVKSRWSSPLQSGARHRQPRGGRGVGHAGPSRGQPSAPPTPLTADTEIQNEDRPCRPLTRVAGCSWNGRPDARGMDGRMSWNAQ